MIYSRFGTRITLTTQLDGSGWLRAIFHYGDGKPEPEKEIHISETVADDGALEVTKFLAGLPPFPARPEPFPATPEEARKIRRCYVCNCDTTQWHNGFGGSGRRKPARTFCDRHLALMTFPRKEVEARRAEEMSRAR